MENELEKKWREIEFDTSDPQKGFCERARFLMNEICLVVGENEYRIVDCEVYYNDGKDHQDPFLHTIRYKRENSAQLKPSHWFFNDANGLDLTFGRSHEIETERIYASVLIRAMINLKKNNIPTIGVTKVAEELLHKLPSAFAPDNWIKLRELSPSTNDPIYRCRRWKLNNEILDTYYRSKEYRYTVKSFLPDKANTSEINKRNFFSSKDHEYLFDPKICTL